MAFSISDFTEKQILSPESLHSFHPASSQNQLQVHGPWRPQLTAATPQQKGVDALPHRAVDKSLAGQGLVRGILQAVAALHLAAAHHAVHQVALCLDMLCSGDLPTIKCNSFLLENNTMTLSRKSKAF